MGEANDYRVVYYIDQKGIEPVKEYIRGLPQKEQVKIFAFIELLREHKGYLDKPYAKHVTGKIRELRIDFARNRHRFFYFTTIGKRIILLHVFLKRTAKTPRREITRALSNYSNFQMNQEKYEEVN